MELRRNYRAVCQEYRCGYDTGKQYVSQWLWAKLRWHAFWHE